MLHLLIHLKIRCPRDLLACRLFIAVAFWLIDRPISNPQVSSYTFIGFLCGSVRLRWHRSYPCPSWLVLAGISYRSRPSFSRCNSNVILYYTSICFWTRVAYSTYFLASFFLSASNSSFAFLFRRSILCQNFFSLSSNSLILLSRVTHAAQIFSFLASVLSSLGFCGAAWVFGF